MKNVYWDYFKYLVRGLPKPSDAPFSFLKPGMLIYDIGANIGNYSSLFLEKKTRVIALEPQGYCYNFLQLRFRRNKNIIVLKKGAGANNEFRELYLSSSHTLSSMNKKWIDEVKQSDRFSESDPEWNTSQKAEIVTLDELIRIYGKPDYIKIDVEGFETETLKGLSSPVNYISFEYTIPELTYAAIENIALIAALGKYSFSLDTEKWFSEEETVNQLNELSKQKSLHNGDIFCRLEQ